MKTRLRISCLLLAALMLFALAACEMCIRDRSEAGDLE